MFRIKPKNVLSPIRSIEQEMLQTRARYEKYLKETSDNFVAKRSNVEIQDPHTMVGNAYWELRNEIDTLNNAAKNANKKVLIQDARVLIRDDEFASPATENMLSSKIVVNTRDKSNMQVNDMKLIDRLELSASEFLKQIIDFINKPLKK